MSLLSLERDRCCHDGICVAECPLGIIEILEEDGSGRWPFAGTSELGGHDDRLPQVSLPSDPTGQQAKNLLAVRRTPT